MRFLKTCKVSESSENGTRITVSPNWLGWLLRFLTFGWFTPKETIARDFVSNENAATSGFENEIIINDSQLTIIGSVTASKSSHHGVLNVKGNGSLHFVGDITACRV